MDRFPCFWLKNEEFGWEGEGLESPEDWIIISNIHEMEVEKLRDCESCHGTGYLKSRCDEPDRICPSCHGTGRDD
jgi:hypothetical protein